MELISAVASDETGLHVDVWMHTTVTESELDYFQESAREMSPQVSHYTGNRWNWCIILMKGDDLVQRSYRLREWLEGLSFVRMVIIEYVDTNATRN